MFASPSSILAFPEMATSLTEIYQSHAHMTKTGLIGSPSAPVRLISAAVSSSSDPPTLAYAHSLFARISTPTSFAWNTMIRAHARSANPEVTLRLFYRMLHSAALPDNFTFPFVLKACSSLPALPEALQIHGQILKTGFGSDIFVLNTLIHVYASAGCTTEAFNLFDRMPQKDVISWNAIISVDVSNGLIGRARALFDKMSDRNVETWNFMISGYVNLGLIDQALELFHQMPCRDLVSWNAMITGCVRVGRTTEAIELFRDMQSANVQPDDCTFVNVLSACSQVGALGQGEWVHAYLSKNEKALQVFGNTSRKDVSTWDAMIDGLSSHGFEGL